MAPAPTLEKKPSRLGLRTTRSKAITKEQDVPSVPTPATPARRGLASMLPMTTGKKSRAVSSKLTSELPMRGEEEMGIPVASSGPAAVEAIVPTTSGPATASSSKSQINCSVTDEDRAIQAYLRIRPPPADYEHDWNRAEPYLEMQGDKRVLMKPPVDPNRPNALPRAAQIYSFNRVFSPSSTQSTFFQQTTLPLVSQVLSGESGLLFAYGVSNSGKTYTIQGGDEDQMGRGSGRGKVEGEERGLIPRSIDVIFNSISGQEIDRPLKAIRQQAIEFLGPNESECCFDATTAMHCSPKEETVIDLDKEMEYAVFVSYAEVYNEKIFDLLESLPVTNESGQVHGLSPAASSSSISATPQRAHAHRAISKAFNIFGSRPSIAPQANANGGTGILKRQALSLKTDPDGGKYISGLKQVRVRTRGEAHAVFKMGQVDRQVFGTCLNQYSSRSHGIFTIKVVRVPKGKTNAGPATVSRLSIVDLAGSERNKNSQTTDEHLREAANINTSLMTLGLCMETLRANQALANSPLGVGKRKTALVPFNHSKLTQIFQSFFVGQGRAAMVVHVNPYDTGFEENSHVMRFSAIAREIQAGPGNKAPHAFGKSFGFDAFRQAVQGNRARVSVPVPILEHSGLSQEAGLVHQDFEIEEVEPEEDDESDVETDCMVMALIEEMRDLRIRLAEAELRNGTLEAEIRQEVVQEMNERIRHLTQMHEKRLMDEIEAHEELTDRKIDILHRSMTAKAFKTPMKTPHQLRMAQYDASKITPGSEGESGKGAKHVRETEEREIEASLFLDNSVSTDSSPSAGRRHELGIPSASSTTLPTIRKEVVIEVPEMTRSESAEYHLMEPGGTEEQESGQGLDETRTEKPQTRGNRLAKHNDAAIDLTRRDDTASDDGHLSEAASPVTTATEPADDTIESLEDDSDEGSEPGSDDDSEDEDAEESSDEDEDDEQSFHDDSVSSQASTPAKKSPARRKSSAAPARRSILVISAAQAQQDVPKVGTEDKRAESNFKSASDSISDDDDAIPDYKARVASIPEGTTYVPAADEKDGAIKKRKRKLGKAVVQEEEMMRDAGKVSGGVQIKRRI